MKKPQKTTKKQVWHQARWHGLDGVRRLDTAPLPPGSCLHYGCCHDVLAAVTLIEDVFGGGQSMSYTRCCITDLALRVILMEGIVKSNVANGTFFFFYFWSSPV